MDFIIRVASEIDRASIEELSWETQQIHSLARPDQHTDIRMSIEDVYRTNIFTNPEYGVFVAVASGNLIVGHIISKIINVKAQFAGQNEYRYLYLHDISVKEKYQGQNIGEGLLENAIKYGKANEAKIFELGVWEFNQDAIAFYEQMGFKTKTRRMELEI